MMGTILLAAAFGATAAQPPGLHVKSSVGAYQSAKAAVQNNQADAAVALFQKAIAIEPTFIEAYEGLADEYLKLGQAAEAGKTMTRLLEIEPNETRYRILLGELLLRQKEKERALAQFSLALQREPNNADALLGFSAAAKQLGMDARAVQALKRGLKQYPGDGRFRAAIADLNQPKP